jgi:hypothetical protein
MAITVVERRETREYSEGDNAAATLRYLITGTSDAEEAVDALKAERPATFSDLISKSDSVLPILLDDVDETKALFEGVCRYGRFRLSPDPEDTRYTFDTTGGSRRIFQSKETIGNYRVAATGLDAKDHKGAINVADDGSVQGVDVYIPVWNFSETHYKTNAQFTTAYKAILYGLTGKVNAAAFKGLAIGECLFLGVTGGKIGNWSWEVTYNFRGSKEQSNLVIGSIENIPTVGGWNLVWCEYPAAVQVGAKSLVHQPSQAHVERLYDTGDFSTMDIGV